MAYTAIVDIINPEVLGDQAGAKFPDHLVLGGNKFAQLVQVDPMFPAGSPGTKYLIPGWKRIGSFAALTEGTPLVPGKIDTRKEYTIIQRAGIALEALDTAQLVSMADPMTEIANQLARRGAEFVDSKLVTALETTPNSYDITAETPGTLDQNHVIKAMTQKFGDNYGMVLGAGALIVHSKVFGDLVQVGAIQNMYQSGSNVIQSGVLPTIMGLPVMISDRVTTAVVSSVTHYNSYIVGPGALGLFYQRGMVVETDRDILKFSNVISASMHFAAHLFGYDEDTLAVTAQDNKSILAIRLKTK